MLYAKMKKLKISRFKALKFVKGINIPPLGRKSLKTQI